MIKMPVIQDIRQMHRDGMSIAEISSVSAGRF